MHFIKFLVFIAITISCYQRVSTVWDAKYLTKFVSQIVTLMQAQEVLWFLSEELTSETDEELQNFMLKVGQASGVTQMVLTNRTDFRITATTNRKNNFGLVFTTHPDDHIMMVHDKILLGRHFYFNMIIFVHTVHNFSIIERFISDMRRRNFQNSILYFHTSNDTNHLYGYTIYPIYSFEDRTDFFAYIMREYKTLASGGLNAQGYVFHTPLREDLPHVFTYKNAIGKIAVRGTAYSVLKLFVDYVNATLRNYEMPKDVHGGQLIDMRAALNLVRTRKIPLLAHAYALFQIDDEIDKSYPIMVVRWCLMVPIWNSVSTFYYPLQPFDDVTWYAVVATFFALVLQDLLALFYQHSLRKRNISINHFGNTILDNFCFVLNIACTQQLKTPTFKRLLFFTTLFFYGFFLTANYTSLLGSILTVTLFRAQINTMEDLINANISVMIIDYELEFLLSAGNDLPNEFMSLLHSVDTATFHQHQLTLNTSYAYFVTEDKWHFLDLQQQYLKLGLFKFTDICFGSYHLAYPMQPDLSIWRNLEYYTYRVHSSGLLQYYESNSFEYAVHAGLSKRLTEANDFTSAGMQHLAIVFILLIVMLILSFIVFLFEGILHWLMTVWFDDCLKV